MSGGRSIMKYSINTGFTIFGSGSFQGWLIEQSENYVFIRSEYETLYIFNKKNIQQGRYPLFNGHINIFAVDPADKLVCIDLIQKRY
jgi:hypothetical protein